MSLALEVGGMGIKRVLGVRHQGQEVRGPRPQPGLPRKEVGKGCGAKKAQGSPKTRCPKNKGAVRWDGFGCGNT